MAELQKDASERCDDALEIARRYGGSQDSEHLSWVIDQMCQHLLGREYDDWIRETLAHRDDLDNHWDTGISPESDSA